MTDSAEWKASLNHSERYDNIQKIQHAFDQSGAGGASRSAFAIENEAYKASVTRDEYDAACRAASHASAVEASAAHQRAAGPDSTLDGDAEFRTCRIGSYENCQYVASGVTAEVYRSGNWALKVITESRNMEPHNPLREASILAELKAPCISLLETFRDQEQRFTLVFPYMPMTLAGMLERESIAEAQVRTVFTDLLKALDYIHELGIIHRDIKSSAVLLSSPAGPAYLSDFGTAWHPIWSNSTEPAESKILDIGTGPYRAPEVLFGNKAYGYAVDMWGAGTILAECLRRPPRPLFESRPAHEDGNQLGLILSIFKTMGSPTRESWPEAAAFKTPPFEMYRYFEPQPWPEILPEVDDKWRHLIAALLKYDSSRVTAKKVHIPSPLRQSETANVVRPCNSHVWRTVKVRQMILKTLDMPDSSTDLDSLGGGWT